MLTSGDWKLIVDAAIERTNLLELEWIETDEGPLNSRCFAASVDEATTLSIWGHRGGYSYQLELVKETSDEVLFEDKKRATTRKNSDGIDFAGLFRAAQRQVTYAAERDAEARRNLAFQVLSDFIATDGGNCDYPGFTLSSRLLELGEIEGLTAEQWIAFTGVLSERTDGETLTWSKDDDSPDESYESVIAGQLKVGLVASRASENEAFTYYIDVVTLENDGSGFGIETDDERIDGTNRSMPAYWALKRLYDAVTKPIQEQNARFQEIVKDDVVHGVLTSLKGSLKVSPSTSDSAG